MNKFKVFANFFILFTIFFIGMVYATSLKTDRASYNFGEIIFIYGSGFSSGQEVAIEIDNPNNVPVFSNQTYPDQNGNFTTAYLIPESDPTYIIEGTYTLYANSQSKSAQTNFNVFNGTATTTTTSTTTSTTTTETTTTTASPATTTPSGGGGGGTTTTTTIITTTIQSATTTSGITTTITTTSETTTTTIQEQKKGTSPLYLLVIILLLITIVIAVLYFKNKKKTKESEKSTEIMTFEELKEKWNQ